MISTSRIRMLVSAYALLGCLIVSCGMGQAPKELTVNVSQRFSGVLHIKLCDKGAPGNNITVDDNGEGATSMCPDRNQGMQLRVVDKKGFEIIPPNMVAISRTGDGFATSLEAKIQAD